MRNTYQVKASSKLNYIRASQWSSSTKPGFEIFPRSLSRLVPKTFLARTRSQSGSQTFPTQARALEPRRKKRLVSRSSLSVASLCCRCWSHRSIFQSPRRFSPRSFKILTRTTTISTANCHRLPYRGADTPESDSGRCARRWRFSGVSSGG